MPLPARRPLLALAALSALALGLAGCGSGSPADRGGTETRTVTDVLGTVAVPIAPETVVALDENAALNLLSIGITPDLVYRSWKTQAPAALIEELGIEVRDTTGASPYPDPEDVASARPDLIVITTAAGQTEALPDYTAVAPTVHALYSAPWREVLAAYGETFDARERTDAIVTALEARAAEIADGLAADGPSIAVLMAYASHGLILSMDQSNPISSVIADAGFARPAAEQIRPASADSHGGWLEFSPEQLPAHDADVIAITRGANYDPDGITSLPLFRELAGARSGATATVDGDLWSGGYAFSTYWVLEDLAAFAAGDFSSSAAAEPRTRWDDFLAEIGDAR